MGQQLDFVLPLPRSPSEFYIQERLNVSALWVDTLQTTCRCLYETFLF